MIRKAFVMSVNPGQHQEYRHRHSPIWPELQTVLRDHGVSTYSIFLHPETSQLFAYVEFLNEKQWLDIANTDVCRKWWAHMQEIMPSNPDNSPISVLLEEVFHFQSNR